MFLIEKITGKQKRKISTSAQLIALPKAVMIYTEEGLVIVTPEIAKRIHENLPQITDQAEELEKKDAGNEKIPPSN